MKRLFFVVALAIVTSLGVAEPAYGKPATAKIRITGGHLVAPLEVTDSDVLKDFSVWHGYLSGGVETASPEDRQRYEIWFYVKFSEDDIRMAFVAYYYPSSAGARGYIYLPRRDEKWYELNASTIRQATGWFHASREWEARIKPLINQAEAAQRSASARAK